MEKKKSYLVYDADETPEETGTLRERLEKESPEPAKEEVIKVKEPSTKTQKNTKKVVERILMVLIAVIMVAIASLVGIYMLNGEEGLINGTVEQVGRIDVSPNTSGLTAKKTFAIISENNTVIVQYFDDVVELLKSDNQAYKTTLEVYKTQISADIKTFSYYASLYDKYDGTDLYGVYMERLMNVLDLIEGTYNAEDKSQAIAAANVCIKKEQVLNSRSVGTLLEWLNTNKLPYVKEGSIIVLK